MVVKERPCPPVGLWPLPEAGNSEKMSKPKPPAQRGLSSCFYAVHAN